MILRRLYDERLSQACYLLACPTSRDAIVIDPPRNIEVCLEAASAESVNLRFVAETHIHADFISGARELAAHTGARLLLSAEGGTDWQYRYAEQAQAQLVRDGDEIAVGSLRLEALHTPGHTPEHLTWAVREPGDQSPRMLLTGDFLFVGDVGRPDLLETAVGMAGARITGARQLWHSLQRLDQFADDVEIFPGHGAGSACGRSLGSAPSSTLGEERRSNWAFQQQDVDGFVEAVLTGQPPAPPYFARNKRVNRDGPSLVRDQRAPVALSPEQLGAALKDGRVLDVRPTAKYMQAHVRGSVNLPLGRSFTRWAGWLLRDGDRIALIADDSETARQTQLALRSIGFDEIPDYFIASELPLNASTDHAPMRDAPSMLQQGTTVIDVRETNEWEAGHLDGAQHHALGTLPQSLNGLDRNAPVALHCQGGSRSVIAASVLESMGFTQVINLDGGYGAISN